MVRHTLPGAALNEEVAIALQLLADGVYGEGAIAGLDPTLLEDGLVFAVTGQIADGIRRVVHDDADGPVVVVAVVVAAVIAAAEAGVQVPGCQDETTAVGLRRIRVVDILADVAHAEVVVLVAPVVGDAERHHVNLVVGDILQEEVALDVVSGLAVAEGLDERIPGLQAAVVLGVGELPGIVPLDHAGGGVVVEARLVLIADFLRAALVEHAANLDAAVEALLIFFQIEQLAVDALREAVDAVIAVVDIELDEASAGAVAALKISLIGQTREVVPDVEGHAVAHADAVDGHRVEYPRGAGAHAQESGVELLRIVGRAQLHVERRLHHIVFGGGAARAEFGRQLHDGFVGERELHRAVDVVHILGHCALEIYLQNRQLCSIQTERRAAGQYKKQREKKRSHYLYLIVLRPQRYGKNDNTGLFGPHYFVFSAGFSPKNILPCEKKDVNLSP